MTNRNLCAVILAGGSGTRLWPLSTRERPKQFTSLGGDRSFLQTTFDRLENLVAPEQVMVVTNQQYVELVSQHLPEIPTQNIIAEPSKKNTAAAVALSALEAQRRFGSDAILITLSADHWVETRADFQRALIQAAEGCQKGSLYTFGITPTFPSTGFGYLKVEVEQEVPELLADYKVQQFLEKPNLQLAQEFVVQEHYFWNSGMFVWRTNAILEQFQKFLPEHLATLEPYFLGHITLEEAFQPLQDISIDHAILEHSQDVRAIIPDIKWSDIGSWPAAEELIQNQASAQRGSNGRTVSLSSENTFTFCENEEEEIVLLGAPDLFVVRSDNRTLIAHRDNLHQLKAAIQKLEDSAGGSIQS